MSRRSDPHAPLLRALDRDAAGHGLVLALRDRAERPWSSATFTGCRLTLSVAIAGGDPARWLAALPEADLPVACGIVADLAVRSATHDGATLEVLLLEA